MEPNAHGPLGEDAPAQRPKQTRRKKSRLGRLPSEITREELAMWFHLPAEEAAKVMRVSLTVLKRIARRHGVVRWPYRKVKSLTRALVLPAPSSAARYSAAAEAAMPAGPSQSNPQLQLLEQQIAAAAAVAATQGSHLHPQHHQPPQPLLLQAQPVAPPLPAHGAGAQLLQGAPPPAPQLPQHWMAYQPQPPHQPQPDATLSGNSQGSRLWGSAVGAAVEPHQQQQQEHGGGRGSPRPPLVRPVAQQWHPPGWQGAVQRQLLPAQHHQPPPAALEVLPPLPPDLIAFRAARMAEAAGAAPAAPQAVESAGVTPTSADTRGIEVLLSAIEREEAGQEQAEQQQAQGDSSSRGGTPPAAEQVVAPPAVVGQARKQAEGAAAAAALAGEGMEEGMATLGSVGSEGGSAGSSTNPALAAPAALPAVSASTPTSPVPRGGASAAAGAQVSMAELLEHATSGLGLPAAGGGAGLDAEAAAKLAVLATLRPASPARPPSPGAAAWQAAGAAAAAAAHHQHHGGAELRPSPFSARTHQARAQRSPSPPGAQRGGLLPALEPSLGAILARQQAAAAAGAAGPPAIEQQQARLGAAGSESMERLPTLEWPTVVAAGGPTPGAPPPHGLGAHEFSFGLQQQPQFPPSAAGAEGVKLAAAVGNKRALPGAAAPQDAGSPAKRPAVGLAPAAAALGGHGSSSEFNLGTIMALLCQAAGMQPLQEQQWNADRRQLLALLMASTGEQAAAAPQQPAPASVPPPPPRAPPALHQAAVLESLLRSSHGQQPSSELLPQQAQQQAEQAPPAAAPAPSAADAMASLAALLRKLQRPSSPSPLVQPAPPPPPPPQLPLPAQQRAPSPRAVVPEPVARFCLEKYARKLGYSIDSLALAMQAQQAAAQEAAQQRQG